MLGDFKQAGKFYAEEHNPHRSGSWPELHIFDSVEERDEFVAKSRDERSLSRADKVAMTQRGEKHWFKRKTLTEAQAFKYVDRLIERGTSGFSCVIAHHRLDPASLQDERARAGLLEADKLFDEIEFDERANSAVPVEDLEEADA